MTAAAAAPGRTDPSNRLPTAAAAARRRRGVGGGGPSIAIAMALLLSPSLRPVRSSCRPASAAAAAAAPTRTAAAFARSAAAAAARQTHPRRPPSSSLGREASLSAATHPPGDASGGRAPAPAPSSSPAAALASVVPYYDRLSRPRNVLAPMVAQSDLPFRLLCRRYGADVSYTQMIHAKNFLKSDDFRYNHLDVYKRGEELGDKVWCGSQRNALDGSDRRGGSPGLLGVVGGGGDIEGEGSEDGPAVCRYPDEGPVVVQLAGHDPATLSRAALRIVERTGGNLAGIDLNLGCPQAIARKGRYGAHLMEEDPTLVCDILRRLREDLPPSVGVSAKIRIPNDGRDLGDRVKRMVDAGVDLITVHGRTLKENKTKVGRCDWDSIRVAVEAARQRSGDAGYPIFANGGIERPSDVRKCLDATGASGIMASESLLENPALFDLNARDDADLRPQQIFRRQVNLASEYLALATVYPPVPGSLGKVGGSFNVVRSHLFKMLYRYWEEHPDLRGKLAARDTVSIPQAMDIVEEMGRRYGTLSDEKWDGLRSSKVGSSWYRRHRGAEERVHRRGDGIGGSSRMSSAAAAELSTVEERKLAMKERISKLKADRKEKEQQRLGGGQRGTEKESVAA